MSGPDPYRAGFDDGLRMAELILTDLEAAVLTRIERGAATRATRDQRKTRAMAYKVARTRIGTRLRARARRTAGDDIPASIKRLGL